MSRKSITITTENISKIGLEMSGEKNINTTIGKSVIPITLSNKKEKNTPNFARDFSMKIYPKR